jgi:hypothetical protein
MTKQGRRNAGAILIAIGVVGAVVASSAYQPANPSSISPAHDLIGIACLWTFWIPLIAGIVVFWRAK